MVQRSELYPAVHDQCALDLQEFCDGVPNLTLTPIEVEDPTTLLGTESDPVFANSTMTEDTSSNPPLFPFECLETDWTEQRASPVCSSALDQLQSLWELQHQQESNVKIASQIFSVIWLFFCTYGVYAYINAIIKWYNWFGAGIEGWVGSPAYTWYVFIWTFIAGFSTTAWVVFVVGSLLYHCYFDRTEDDYRNQNGSFPESKQAGNSGTPRIDSCVCCCCKTPYNSDKPSTLAETSCECCNNSGVCNAACDHCCCATRAVSHATTEKAKLVPIPVVGE